MLMYLKHQAMKNTENNTKELVLEVVKDGYRRLIFRTNIENGSVLFLEDSDLIDFSRPITDNSDFNVFFTMRSFWKSVTEFTSNEGLLKRQVWHETNHEWLNLKPVFVHADIKHLIQESLADATRNIQNGNSASVEGIRTWLRKLAEPTTELDNAINPSKKYRYAV